MYDVLPLYKYTPHHHNTTSQITNHNHVHSSIWSNKVVTWSHQQERSFCQCGHTRTHARTTTKAPLHAMATIAAAAAATAQPASRLGNCLELASRMITTNPPREVFLLVKTLKRVLENIVGSPQERKYRTLKVSNATLQRKIISITGGLQFLLAAGFEDRGSELVLEDPVDQGALAKLIRLLEHHKTTVGNLVNQHGSGISCCCECSIQIGLPSGKGVPLGFSGDDTLLFVRNFVGASGLIPQRDFSLSTVAPARELEGDVMQCTLRGLGFLPRTKLVVRLARGAGAPGDFEETDSGRRARLLQEEQERQASMEMVEKVQQAKLLEKRAKKRERKQAVSAFREDRDDVQRRVSSQLSRLRTGQELANEELRAHQELLRARGLIAQLPAEEDE